VSVVVEEDIFRLEVAVYDVQVMQVVQGERDFCRVELGDGIWESLPGG